MIAGYVSLLYSISEKPLEYWSKHQSQSGRIRKILDSDLLENVIEVQDFEQPNNYGTSILCPSDSSRFLNIKLPILVIVIKNLNSHCRLQVQVVDTQNCLHHFQFTNAESERYNSKGVICRVRVKLETGWNKLELNLSQLTQAAFNATYAATQRLQICSNCRLRRIYFIDRHYEHQEVSSELYHSFLDTYMLKWGIRGVEKSTQTNVKRTKSRFRETNDQNSSKHLSGDNVNSEHSNDSKGTKHKLIDENFLKNLQIKSNILINDFFDRQGKLPRTSEFKRHAKLKHYSLPITNTKFKHYDTNLVSEDPLKKLDTHKMYTDMSIPSEEKNVMSAVQEKWHDRYFLRQEKIVDAPKRNMKRTMLDQKPKSMLILSEARTRSEYKMALGVQKSAIETVEHECRSAIVKQI